MSLRARRRPAIPYTRPTRPPPAASPEAGFSLVEMLVGLVLVGVIAALMAAFFQQLRHFERLRAAIAVEAELAAVVRYLETSLAEAMPLPLLDGTAGPRPYLVGGRDSIRFSTVARQGADRFALRETTIALRRNGAEAELVQWFRPRRAAGTGDAEGGGTDRGEGGADRTEVVLATGVSDVAFRYLPPGGGDGAWRDGWAEDRLLPRAVAIEVGLARGGVMRRGEGWAIVMLAGAGEAGGGGE